MVGVRPNLEDSMRSDDLLVGVLDDILDRYTTAELEAIYLQMTRNITAEDRQIIEATGPLSEDSFVRDRQRVYRAWCASRGVVISSTTATINHHPV